MASRKDMIATITQFLSKTSFHHYQHFLIGGCLKRTIWVIFGLACHVALFYSIYLLYDEFKKSPAKTSTSRGKNA